MHIDGLLTKPITLRNLVGTMKAKVGTRNYALPIHSLTDSLTHSLTHSLTADRAVAGAARPLRGGPRHAHPVGADTSSRSALPHPGACRRGAVLFCGLVFCPSSKSLLQRPIHTLHTRARSHTGRTPSRTVCSGSTTRTCSLTMPSCYGTPMCVAAWAVQRQGPVRVRVRL